MMHNRAIEYMLSNDKTRQAWKSLCNPRCYSAANNSLAIAMLGVPTDNRGIALNNLREIIADYERAARVRS